jgi:hypothetical protein
MNLETTLWWLGMALGVHPRVRKRTQTPTEAPLISSVEK